jgi:hypothetical protein
MPKTAGGVVVEGGGGAGTAFRWPYHYLLVGNLHAPNTIRAATSRAQEKDT